jgi:hypothetical protein
VADINVERKGPSIWPWIVGLIVLALIIWALTQMFRDDTRTTPVTPVDTPAATVDTAPAFGTPPPDTAAVNQPPAAPGVTPGAGPGTPPDTAVGAPGAATPPEL